MKEVKYTVICDERVILITTRAYQEYESEKIGRKAKELREKYPGAVVYVKIQ